MTDVIRSTSPQHPGDLVGEWPDAGAAGVDAAVEPGRVAASGWRASGPYRSKTLYGSVETSITSGTLVCMR